MTQGGSVGPLHKDDVFVGLMYLGNGDIPGIDLNLSDVPRCDPWLPFSLSGSDQVSCLCSG